MKKLALLLAIILTGCNKDTYETFTGFSQGTTYTIVARNAPDDTAEKIDRLFREMDTTFSMFNPTSLTSRLNRGETDATTTLFEECFAISTQVHRATDGFYDPTVKPLSDAWGFGPEKMQTVPDLDSLMEFVGLDKVRLEASTSGDGNHIIKTDPRVQFDFSSIAKGFTVDKLAEMLSAAGVTDYMVEVGGEVRARGVNASGRTWRIQIDKPQAGFAHEQQAVVELGADPRTAAVATSGNYRNWFVDEAGQTRVHTIDPKTGTPAAGEILSASVIAPSCALADGWATALVAIQTLEGAKRLIDNAPVGVEYYIIYSRGEATETIHSENFPLSK